MANAPRQPDSVETLREEVAALERIVARLRAELGRPPRFRRRRPGVMTVLLIIEAVVAFFVGYSAMKNFDPSPRNCRNEITDAPHLRV